MTRRALGFLARPAAVALAAAFLALLPAGASAGRERGGTVTFDISVAEAASAREVKLWFPYPTSDLDQDISDLHFDGNYASFTLSREPRSGALYLFAQWSRPAEDRRLRVTFHARSRERRAKLAEGNGPIPVEVRKYLESEFWVPVDDPRVRRAAAEATAGRKGILARARAVYDWTLANTRRDPDVPGCGFGNVEATLASRSGKCADISSVFVAVARAAGVPAREVFGLRLGRPGQTDLTDEHHCWAEFYLPGTGWVPVDPADVRKAMLETGLDLAGARAVADYYFGTVDEYRIVLHKGGRGLSFPEGSARVSYFMYPYAEVDGAARDYCVPSRFAYRVEFRED